MPAPATVIARGDPGLVDVDEPLSCLQVPEKLYGALLSLDEASLGVPMNWERDDLLVSKAEFFFQDPPHLVQLERYPCLLLVCLFHVLSSDYHLSVL